MKKRLISLLLAVAMMLAVMPATAWADSTVSVNSDLRINADGIPYNVSDETQNQNNESVSGNGWKYTHGTTLTWLDLGVDSSGNALSGNPVAFKFTNPTSSSCAVNIYNASLSDSTTNSTVRVYSPDVTVTNCVFNSNLHIMSSVSAPAVVKNCIFTNPSYAISSSSSYTLEGWNIFANDPEISNKHTIHVINHGRITKLNVGNTEVTMDTANLYIVGTLDSDLKLTLDDGTVYTVSSSLINNGYSSEFPKPVPLVITSDGMPDISNMTEGLCGSYVSDDWLYASGEQTLCLKSGFKGSVGPNPVKCQVENAGIITGGVFYGMVSSAFDAAGTIQGGIFLGTVAADQNITGGVFVHDQVSGVHTVSSPAELGKIKTITLGNDAVTLDEPVDSFHFGGQPTNLSVTLEDGTVYHIDPSKEADGTVTLEPKPEEPDYYTVIVEGGEARNERGDILDSEVALTAGEKITLKLLDETQGEMAFSHWDVNNGDTDLADELAKTGFDKTAHETTFTMPSHNLTLTAKYRMPDEDAPQDDSFLMTAAAVTGGAVLTGLVVWQGYNIFSQVYLNAHLPEGTAIPTNRQQLALLLWNTAGQPEASAASYVFPDVADPDVQTAARWATEQGLFKARKDGTFAPTDSVTTGQVYRAWQKVK